ncbi:MAG: twin-arginine translocase subunit TatC [Gemmatimonadales bacterium]
MKSKKSISEMPFLDHLEELRWRILWSLAALLVGTVAGFFLVQQYDILALLKEPIAPFLPDGKLIIIRPADAFIITLKLAVVIGAVLASPVIFAQVWKFLSPALFAHERRYIVPALLSGLGLFLAGALMAYLLVLPAVLRILYGFQYGFLEWMITADAYFGFATRLIMAFGLMFQLPLVIVLLSVLDLVRPQTFAKHRPLALVFAAVMAALLTPPDVFSMLMMIAPLLILYESGILIAKLIGKRRTRTTIGGAIVVLGLLGGLPGDAHAQLERPSQAQLDSMRAARDSLGGALDSAEARELGLPTGPSRSFPPPDSIIRALQQRAGFHATRYMGDSITLFGETQEIVMVGQGLVEREGATLEAENISFRESECSMVADGDPKLFDQGTVMVGEGMRYDTCERIGTVEDALTSFEQSGVKWYLRGAGLEIDSGSTRLYGASNDVTSCNQPIPHYHFAAGEMKWVNNTVMVARPAILYVQDVPILWLPFIFQDMRRGRRSGLLVPRFGISDIVRPNSSYERNIFNIGFYVAASDYVDFQLSVDWFSGNYVALNGQMRYSWLSQFMAGGLSVSRIWEEGTDDLPGDRSLRLQWNHQQTFGQKTSLTASVDFATKTDVVQRNAVDPFVQTAVLTSRVNFNKQYDWGTFTFGATRNQDLSNETTTQTLPSISLTPVPINLAREVTWSPSFSFNNRSVTGQGSPILVPLPPEGGEERFDSVRTDVRNTDFSFRTPIRFGRWNWQNDVSVTSMHSSLRQTVTLPDPDNPGDSLTRTFREDFSTGIDWNTGINLPMLFPSSWKFQPRLGVRNITGGPFFLRNRNTRGAFVSQGKRFSLSTRLTPTVFGFYPGAGPYSRMRHSLSPIFNWEYAPSAEIPEEYANAINPSGASTGTQRSPTLNRISLGLSQTFEAKLRLREDDTTGTAEPRKVKLLSWQTSPMSYDFEQAKEPGRSGWATQRLTNQFTSELLRGFSLALTHDLWDGPVGIDTTSFDPFLTSLSMRFSLTGGTFQRILAPFTGRDDLGPPEPGALDEIGPERPTQLPGSAMGPTTRLDRNFFTSPTNTPRAAGLRASITYDLQRTRPRETAEGDPIETPSNRVLGFTIQFAPTRHWNVNWNTQYNFTTKEFDQQVLRLDRDLHRWRVSFAFMRAPNGNIAFNFFISLMDQPEIRFQYDQRSTNN